MERHELLEMVGADPIGMFAPDGSILPLSEIPESIKRGIASYEVVDGDAIVKMHDKVKVLADLCETIALEEGWFFEDVDISH